jgi:hypothetical protein
LLGALSGSRRQRYQTLTAVCHDIETASADQPFSSADPGGDPRLRKLDELMWTFLRMLTIEESIERFLETERRDNVPRLVQEAEEEAARLSAEFDSLKARRVDSDALETQQRLVSSRLERLEVLRKRSQRIEQAHANLRLVASEEDRLEEQIKLTRADAMASKNADTLTARLDATVEHLDQTNRWLKEMDEFKDLVGELPSTPGRLGYESAAPPVISPRDTPAKTAPQRVRLNERK